PARVALLSLSCLRTTMPWRGVRLVGLSSSLAPLIRRASTALSKSPSASLRAFLQSIMPAPVWSRSFLTSAAVKFAMTVLGFPSEMESLVCFRGAVDPPTQGCRPVALTAGRQGEKWLLAGLGSLDRGVDGRLDDFGILGRG